MPSSASSKPKKKPTTETVSTLLEVYGMVIFAGGWALYRLWVGVTVLGLELILIGMALGMGEKVPAPEQDEVT
jgi:hypothetical protein